MEKNFTTLRKSVFGQADPDGEKKFLLPLRIAEKLRVRSMLRKLLGTQDVEPGRSKTPPLINEPSGPMSKHQAGNPRAVMRLAPCWGLKLAPLAFTL